jgi:hypothetical protein
VTLLQETGEKTVELYGVWDGDFDKSPRASEDISVKRILDPDFLFKEQGFYTVQIGSEQGTALDSAALHK